MNLPNLRAFARRAADRVERFYWRLRVGTNDLFSPRDHGYALKPVPVWSDDAPGGRSRAAARVARRGAP